MNKSSSINSKVKRQPLRRKLSHCRICGDSAVYSYYGVISCVSCKMFFKRNAEEKQYLLKCNSDGHCEMNIYNRSKCSCCRLRKCFKSGMQVAMIRSARGKLNKTPRQKKLIIHQLQKISTTLVTFNDPKQFHPIKLLAKSHATFSIKQWNLLSKLSHCFDEYTQIERGQRYVSLQKILPVKFRFQSKSLIPYFQISLNDIQSLYKNNQDFRSLSSHDRSILLHSTIQHTANLASSFIHHQIGLTKNPAFYPMVSLLLHPKIVSLTKSIQHRLRNVDTITMKLFLVILSFSTTSGRYYSNTCSMNLSNTKQVFHIQNAYIELAWKYLVHRYSFERGVMCYSDLIQCLFLVDEAVGIAQNFPWYKETIDSAVDQIQQDF